MILNVDELKFMYRNKGILDEIAFSINEGEIVAILGPNGVGKTTLLKCLNRILVPKQGAVSVCGDSLNSLELMEVARRIGYVPQRVETGRLTGFDAVLLGRRPHIGWDVTGNDLKIVEAAFRAFGIERLRLHYIDEMSGGELQMVAIARAFVQEPKILLLDEPTSALDLKNQIEILHRITAIVEEHNIAVVMTMHDLNTALRYADRFILLKDQFIHTCGDRSVVTAAEIEAVYGVPVMIGELEGVTCVIPQCLCNGNGRKTKIPIDEEGSTYVRNA
ncbi:MAG: ABC transporter ATP-binding protein [Methanocalculus sp. MSAO_Arc1]|uniref:ABC transporter ATP-binding protein n=1 Tax=Methanocalculus TaxID=71151 RepID=UPI000FF82FFC|nr:MULTISPECIES: ABC transporter ATP-binding protein [unclassified Methanocalculus]MCP1661702.1 iron complex transport system ATP-binding protein [Methanocalculus sp. AMF5]RQD80502.1 MAG: ABC transporter ATP-binding protein [Methanocalculus sp. MSAO_Arc1]